MSKPNTLPLVPQQLPRFLRHAQKLEDERKLAAILLETGEALPDEDSGRPMTTSADGHRDDRRRGLPMIGRGTSGAIAGTNPLAALISKESRRRR